ncbi:MAG TPA: CARDB domain-containing protein, partial [Candidatus Thermoplasmatota archaeon]|nr:CARDB domain-containing protein [Candidatus Thermoplasmatota archaeon]
MGVAPGGAAAFRSGVMAAAVTFMLLAPGCLGEPMRTGEPAAAAPTVGDAGARATPGSAPTQAVDAPAREGAEAHPGGVPGEKGLLSLEDRKPCLGPLQEVPLQGLSCPVGGGWRIFLENGASFFTHGPDSNVADGTAEAGSSATTDLPEPFSEPVCGDGPGAKAGHVLVAVPSDLELTPHRLAEYRNAVLQANAFLRAEAAAFGVETNLRVVCDAAGSLLLHVVNLPELDKDYTSFTKVISEVARQGFHSFGDKYWIFYHGRARGVGGQATLDEDDSPGPGNRNNFGPSYAIVWGSASAHVFLHEVSHNLGAVQNSAPHSSGSHHCIDGLDTMCYPDSGPRAVAYTELSCNRRRYDCGNDDYFNPKPEPGTYLATHWNLGGPNNLWFDRCAPAEAAAARDLALCRIHAPRWRLGGETVTLSLALYNFGLFTEQGARLQVRVDGAPLTEVAVPDLPPGGPHVIRVPWATPEGGAVHVVTASLLAAESPTLPREENTANNEARTKAARLAGTEGSAVPRSLRAVSVDHAKREATLTWAPPEKDPTHAWRYQVYLRTGSATAAPAPLGEPVNHTAFT